MPRSIRARDRRGDHHHRERRALVGTGEIRRAAEAERVGAGTGCGRDRPDRAVGPQLELACSALPRAGRRGRDRRLGAVRDAGEFAGQPFRQGHVDDFQLLLAVGTPDVHPERAVGAGFGAVGFGRVAAARISAPPSVCGQVPPPGTLERSNFAPTGSCLPGTDHGSISPVVSAVAQVGGLVSTAFEPSKLQLDRLEGHLRQALRQRAGELAGLLFVEHRGQLPGDRVRFHVADQARDDPLVHGLRFDQDPEQFTRLGVRCSSARRRRRRRRAVPPAAASRPRPCRRQTRPGTRSS